MLYSSSGKLKKPPAMEKDFSLVPPTLFAPADRENSAQVHEESAMITQSDFARGILEALDVPAAVINESRQIIYANEALLKLAGAKSLEDGLGLRLGELLGCTHAVEDLSGCGTHPSCRTCGTVNGALTALDGEACATMVDIALAEDDGESRLEFQLTATPMEVQGRRFALLRLDPV